MNGAAGHQPVMRAAVVEALNLRQDGVYLDATFGRGGHSAAILQRLGTGGRLLAMDRDPEAIAAAREMAAGDPRLEVIDRRFGELRSELAERRLEGAVDGILFDLGLSSPQVDDSSRGFSFSGDGPLDMRMDPRTGSSAAEWIETASERELADAIFRYGEERHSRRIAARIIKERKSEPIATTGRLAAIVAAALPRRERRKHPATRAFQGIRIHINEELDELHKGLAGALEALRDGGRLAVISFHSLEDRIVKRFILEQSRGDDFPRDLPVTKGQLRERIRPIGKSRRATAIEVARNPRARSAVLRVAEKLQ
ncbi:MAG: 16S rRNA (cytosine(1402)-N(4))-methyltransferase RsmH [Gammaproteobacteria bacterium]|nr:16S rRNA (cytosine(1402)-N(4))-methyltransferase RsmH [Gammaproteobacteria bacterium]MXY91398.1 16S rRNA (cytosine(1402)-N(4))-methyltransferase RsmH [Gammaproteobacteria bacterium]MXZ32748.1 16S rRNA (cytosine(1402)-N(4))-methyltransferase RsmH [Gammaproteobacteria bacterium]MYA36789.1 16S rRNA (cytosine(1402)-N(4))-methyltransferase RsmH [Gammaproteobacteria bacterium]MYE99500.1 16S rRNA (cytosine(1402)-N(4))-methyltransferase RsmH [Gammaproteobacteria bacterium]